MQTKPNMTLTPFIGRTADQRPEFLWRNGYRRSREASGRTAPVDNPKFSQERRSPTSK